MYMVTHKSYTQFLLYFKENYFGIPFTCCQIQRIFTVVALIQKSKNFEVLQA